MDQQPELLKEAAAVLKLASTYGDGLDLSGPRITTKIKQIVKGLLDLGYLSGGLKNLSLTQTGKDFVKKIEIKEE